MALPSGWAEHLDDEGRPYYHHPQLAQSTYQHPIDTCYLARFLRYRCAAGGALPADINSPGMPASPRLQLSTTPQPSQLRGLLPLGAGRFLDPAAPGIQQLGRGGGGPSAVVAATAATVLGSPSRELWQRGGSSANQDHDLKRDVGWALGHTESFWWGASFTGWLSKKSGTVGASATHVRRRWQRRYFALGAMGQPRRLSWAKTSA
eukprot:COSAG01_NODE_18602_length_1065_cov_0.894410_2_plen_206_part_00